MGMMKANWKGLACGLEQGSGPMDCESGDRVSVIGLRLSAMMHHACWRVFAARRGVCVLMLAVASVFVVLGGMAGCRQRSQAEAVTSNGDDQTSTPSVPPKVEVADPQLSRALEALSRGIKAGDAGDVDGAIIAFRQAIGIKPDFAEARAHLGAAWAMKGDLPSAISELREAVRLKPDYAVAQANLGMALLDSGDAEGAANAAASALMTDPDQERSLVTLGMALTQLEEYDRAIEILTEAIEKRPDVAELQYQLARAMRLSGDTEGAIAGLERVHRLSPKHVFALLDLARIRYDKGEMDGALELGKRASEADPYLVEAHLIRAEVHLARGEVEGLEEAARAAARQDMNNPRAHYLMGRGWVLREKHTWAMEEYQILRSMGSPLASQLFSDVRASLKGTESATP